MKWIDRSWRLLELLMAAGLAAMVVLVFTNVVLRYGFNTGVSLSEELSRWLFVWVIFLGSVIVQRESNHLGTQVLIDRLPPRVRRFCFLLSHAVILYLLWLLFIGGVSLVGVNFGIRAPTSGWSMAILYLPCVIFAVLAAMLVAGSMISVLRGGPLPGDASADPSDDAAAASSPWGIHG